MNNQNNNLKNKLDLLLEKYQAQPIGNGYIDIIVIREKFMSFVEEILNNGFLVSYISWWEYIESTYKEPKYGLGGPSSKFLDGWFAEIPINIDIVNTNDTLENQLKEIYTIIENKEIKFADGEKITFKNNDSLTPAFWLIVPGDWENNILLKQKFVKK